MLLRTVLVEDNKKIRDVLIPAMEELGNVRVVGVAETSKEGIAIFERLGKTWELAVVDLFLREGSGLSVLRALGGRAPGQSAVVLTNYVTPTIVASCLDLGADRVFDKSTELDAFFEYCRALSSRTE
jgi:DNA-binding NarL/FixJ family response regulator